MHDVLLLLGQIKIMASLHSLMSESVGCLLGHLIVDHASPCGQRKRVSAFTLLPKAVSISNMNSNWRETLTLFRQLSALSVYPALTSTCMINWSPSLGLAGKVADMLATCRPDSQMLALLADIPLSW
jgi:hypothetical protein